MGEVVGALGPWGLLGGGGVPCIKHVSKIRQNASKSDLVNVRFINAHVFRIASFWTMNHCSNAAIHNYLHINTEADVEAESDATSVVVDVDADAEADVHFQEPRLHARVEPCRLHFDQSRRRTYRNVN